MCIAYFTSNSVVSTDGSSQRSNDTLNHVVNVSVILPFTGLDSTRLNHNAEFCIFRLNEKNPPHHPL